MSKFVENTLTETTLTVDNVQVFVIKESSGKTKAIARLVLGGQLQLTGLRVIHGSNGYFVSFPSDPNYKGEDYRSIYYPITKELRTAIEEAVLERYREVAAH